MNAIGIDLGTTNCCMAVVKNDRPEIIATLDGRTTPSYVSFTDSELLIGSISKDRLPKNPNNTIYDVKRFIGLKLSSKPVQDGLKKWGFQLVSREGNLKVFVKTNTANKFYSPEEISAILLRNLKESAEKYLDSTVSKAVITVPTYFNDAQRQATIDAGRIAGFKEISLLNEPTAAAIAYVMENNISDTRKVAIFDFGGGTFDISIVQISDNKLDVLAIDGDLCLGGNDVDDILFEYVVKYIIQHYQYNIKQDNLKVYRLRQKCEAIKKQLGTCVEAYIDCSDLVPNVDELEINLSRAEFDKLCENIYKKNSAILDKCLKKANLMKSDINDIVMVGGSTKIQSLNTLLKNYFQMEPKHSVNPDEAVAVGAAIHASKLTSQMRYKDLVFIDITPYSLGVETVGGEMNVIIPKYSKLPTKNKKIFCSTKDMQKVIKVKIYAGEDTYTKNNNYLGCVEATGFVRGPKGSVKLEETFAIDENGILTVTVMDITTQQLKDLKISLDKGRLTEEEILNSKSEVIHEFHKMLKIKTFKKLKNDLVKMCTNPLIMLEHDTNAIYEWLQNSSIENIDEVQHLHDELNDIISEAGS